MPLRVPGFGGAWVSLIKVGERRLIATTRDELEKWTLDIRRPAPFGHFDFQSEGWIHYYQDSACPHEIEIDHFTYKVDVLEHEWASDE